MYCIDTDRLPLVYLLLVVSVLTLQTSSISLDSAINLSQLQSNQEERDFSLSVGTGVVDERRVVVWSYGGQHLKSSFWEFQRCTGPWKLQPVDIFKLVVGNFPSVASSSL